VNRLPKDVSLQCRDEQELNRRRLDHESNTVLLRHYTVPPIIIKLLAAGRYAMAMSVCLFVRLSIAKAY